MPTRSVAYGPAGHRYSPAKPEHTRYREANQAYPVTSHGQQQVGPEFESGIETSFGSPPVNTFAFQAPRQSSPGLYHQLPNEADLDRYPTASTSYYAEQPSTSTSTVSSSGLRPATMSTRRPSTGATSIAVHAANEVSAAHKLEVEVACVKNLIGAVTTNGHKLKAPGEAGLGIFFVFHDLRYVLSICTHLLAEFVLIGVAICNLYPVYAPRARSPSDSDWSQSAGR